MCCHSFMMLGIYAGFLTSNDTKAELHQDFTVPSHGGGGLHPPAQMKWSCDWKAQSRSFWMLLQPLHFRFAALRAGPIESRVKRKTVASVMVEFSIWKTPSLR